MNTDTQYFSRRSFLRLAGSSILLPSGLAILAGCGGGGGGGGSSPGGGTSPAGNGNSGLEAQITPNAAYTSTVFQGQSSVGSSYGLRVSRLALFHNVANTPNGTMNALLFGSFDQSGLPTGITQAAVYGTDPSTAVYVLYDDQGRPAKLTQPSSGSTMTLTYSATDPNQITVMVATPTQTAQYNATFDSSDNVSLQPVGNTAQPSMMRPAYIKQKPHAATGISSDGDDNPTDNDGDEAGTDITACNGDASCENTTMFNALKNLTVSTLEYHRKLFKLAEAVAIALALTTSAPAWAAVAAAYAIGSGVLLIATRAAAAPPPASSDVSTDDSGIGLPPAQDPIQP